MEPARREELEQVIAARRADGDLAAAATAAIKGYGPEILGFLVVATGHPQLSADIFSDYCEDLWRGLPGFRGESTFRTWSYRLAYHALARARRDAARKRGRVAALSDVPEVAAVVDHVRTRTLPHLRTEVKAAVAQLRDRLDEDERTLLVLRIDRRLPWDEIAMILDPEVPTPEARRRLSAALRKRFERIKQRLHELARTLAVDDGS
ncbi:MAG: sigma-70 family RNA polymerase sigma factor [Nannocystaceae bacterium]|nr:sigma-70 family RNA polymerase sigma factor [Nannocystaceae bacterium]